MAHTLKKKHMIFDTEIIGKEDPVFLTCVRCAETREQWSFWQHVTDDIHRFLDLFEDPQYTWVGFNSWKFDLPLIAAWINGYDPVYIKMMANRIINENLMPWQAYEMTGMGGLEVDHIDLMETAPGVMVSLKTYAGRMHYPTMVDLPFHHDRDLTDEECSVLEQYCLNDLGVTEALWRRLKDDLALRVDLGKRYDLDLRSKSGAQVAEAVLKKEVGLGRSTGYKPPFVDYKAPPIIQTDNPELQSIIYWIMSIRFRIDNLGSPVMPEFLEEPITLNGGIYKMGIGGLHSQHDQKCHFVSDDKWQIMDVDVASYYPSIMLKCGLVPDIAGKGERFIQVYEDLFHERIEAKHAGKKSVADALKLILNSTFGKFGNQYCSFYAPELMLAVTITGQLNLLCLIDKLTSIKGVEVISANTDGITLRYRRTAEKRVKRVIDANTRLTGFEYEYTPYRSISMKDVNNYIAVMENGSVKSKGLYADEGLQKNPTMPVCALAVEEYLSKGVLPEVTVRKQRRIQPFLAIRNVKGGGVQHTGYETVDDWEELERGLWRSESTGKLVKRVSSPKPFLRGVGGEPFGRVARWYMTTEHLPPITYVSNGNQVPKTEGAKLCMTLPAKLPADLNRQWYIDEAYRILADLGVAI